MSSTAKPFRIRALDEPGLWYTDVSRYHSWVVGQLAHLKEMHDRLELEDQDLPEGDVPRSSVSPSRWSGYLERNMLSDTIVVFSAMTAEAFLNFYGVVRLTEAEFSAHFERLGIVPKLRQLLLVCDGLSISAKDPLVNKLASLASRRNDLVHPKTKEPLSDGSMPKKWKRPVLDNAVQAAEELDAFLLGFTALVPDAKHLLPSALRTDA
jgi:hypothetical protein